MKKIFILTMMVALLMTQVVAQEAEGAAAPATTENPDSPPQGMPQAKFDKAKTEAAVFLNGMVTLTEQSISGLTGATDAKIATKVIENYTRNMGGLKRQGDRFDRKYPELKARQEPPTEVKALIEKFTSLSQQFGEAIKASGEKFGTDKKYIKALNKLSRVMK